MGSAAGYGRLRPAPAGPHGVIGFDSTVFSGLGLLGHGLARQPADSLAGVEEDAVLELHVRAARRCLVSLSSLGSPATQGQIGAFLRKPARGA